MSVLIDGVLRAFVPGMRLVDMVMARADTACTVLNTPPVAASSAPESRGFFTPIVCLWPGSAKAEKESARAKAQGRLQAVLKYLAAPSTGANIHETCRRPTMAAQTPITEARARLSTASHALNALMTMLSPTGDPVEQEDLYCLLGPIQGEVDAALDELKVIKGEQP
jgi:hypothetical protein